MQPLTWVTVKETKFHMGRLTEGKELLSVARFFSYKFGCFVALQQILDCSMKDSMQTGLVKDFHSRLSPKGDHSVDFNGWDRWGSLDS